MSLIIAVLMLGVIIMVHEFGRSLFAELDGIGVTGFSLDIGLGLFSLEKGDTRYSFKILPFGGSHMMLGEDEGITDESTFNNKPVWARISVVAAEPVFNLILASGPSMVLTGTTGYDTTRLAGTTDGYPAQVAGMEADDVIKSINDREVYSCRDINWYLFTHPWKSPKVTWEGIKEGEGTERFSTGLEPVSSTENNQHMMGVQLNPVPSTVESVGQLLIRDAYEIQYWIHYVFDTFYVILHGMVSINDISGPVGIVNAIDTAADETAFYGLSTVMLMPINLTILLSANLGVMNLLPTPALGGGRLVFLIIEAVRGKSTGKEKGGMIHMAGMIVLSTLMVLILFGDVRKLS